MLMARSRWLQRKESHYPIRSWVPPAVGSAPVRGGLRNRAERDETKERKLRSSLFDKLDGNSFCFRERIGRLKVQKLYRLFKWRWYKWNFWKCACISKSLKKQYFLQSSRVLRCWCVDFAWCSREILYCRKSRVMESKCFILGLKFYTVFIHRLRLNDNSSISL